MGKTGWIILIVCVLFAVCVCAGVIIAGRAVFSLFTDDDARASSGYKDLDSAYLASGVYTVEMKKLKDLTIDWVAGSVIVELTNDDVIRFEETAAGTIREKDALRYSVSGGKLRIQACKKNHRGALPEKNLTLYLPRVLADGLEKLDLNSVSASVAADSLSAREVSLSSVSGAYTLTSLTADKVNANTVSGSLEISPEK